MANNYDSDIGYDSDQGYNQDASIPVTGLVWDATTITWDDVTVVWDDTTTIEPPPPPTDTGGGEVVVGGILIPPIVYRVVVSDRFGVVLEEIPAKNLQYTFELNGAGSVSFSLPQYHPKANYDLMTPGARNITVFRNETLVWGGRLWTASTDAESPEIQFGGNGWFSLLLKRYIKDTQSFKDDDQFDIAWDLVNLAQSDDPLGITRYSSLLSGRVRTRRYPAFERKNIGEALQELSELNDGFDFELTPDLQWRTYYPQKGISVDATFQTGKNIRGYSVQYDATNIENEITGIGAGDGKATLLSDKSATASISTYGLMQGTRSWKDVNKKATLDDHTLEALRVSKNIMVRPEFSIFTNEPPFGSYSVGDTVRVIIDDGYNQLDGAYRISTITIGIADSGFEAVGLFFDDPLDT